MTQEEEIAHLRAENQALREALNQALAQLSQGQEDLRLALVRIEELEKQKTPPPEFVKANVKKPKAEEKKQRKKRATEHNHGRPRSAPTQIVEHRIVTCPDCQLRLGGISLARVREVIDVPPPPSVEVTHHRIFKGWCAGCQKWHEAPVDFHTEVLGQGRLGVRLSSLIATLRTVMRLPIRQIRQLLLSLHGVEVSIGEIVEVLHRISTHAQPLLADLKATIRASPAVQADETGWREDGLNGYIWSVSIPTARYYEYHHSRAGEVVKQLLGETFQGVLGSDFYAGYNIYQGFHQRCWVHYLRDIHKLKDKYPNDEEVWRWAKAVKNVYDQAVAWVAQGPDPGWSPRQLQQMRVAQQHVFEQQRMAPSASRTWERPRLSRPCANAWKTFYPNCLCSWRCQAFLRTTIWPSAVCALWSLLARSAAAHAPPKAQRPA
jgi:transposase